MSIPNPAVDSRFLSVTPIRYSNGGHATGFYFIHEDEAYLITNKHAVDIQSVNGEPLQSIRIYIRPDDDSVGKVNHYDLRLVDEDGCRNWYSHPEDPTIDVAVVPLSPPVVDDPLTIPSLATEDRDRMGSKGFDLSHIPRADEMFVGARGIVLFGYPFSVTNPYFPVARNALSASPYGYPYRGKPRFMTDARTHEGMSGAPILTQPSPMQANPSGGFDVHSVRKAWFLIGIHSNTLSTDLRQPLDLNEGWYSTLLKDIFESIKTS